MNRVRVYSITMCIVGLLATPRQIAHGCTEICIEESNVAGRTMDWPGEAGTVAFYPRGVSRQADVPAGEGEPLPWVSKYGSVVFNLTMAKGAEGTVDGMNEHGLSASSLWLEESVYPPKDTRPVLDDGNLVQFCLDNFKTVQEALDYLPAIRITPDVFGKFKITIHYFLHDPSGDSAVIEYLDGKRTVYTGSSLPLEVLANDPYAKGLQSLREYKSFGGKLPLPGGYGSMARFVRAASFLKRLPSSLSSQVAVAYAFDAMADVAEAPGTKYPTQWTIVRDLTNKRLYYRTRDNQEIRIVDLARLDFSEGKPVKTVDINADITGDISSRLGTPPPGRAKETPPENWYDGFLFENESFIFEFIRVLGYAYEKGADLGECVATAKGIRDGDIHSWYEQWNATADRVYDLAMKLGREGNAVSAREAYLRASNYYRVAGFYMHAKDNRPRALETWRKSRDSFRKAIGSMDTIETITIPYEGTTLPGYFVKTVSKEATPPLLIVHTGFDGTGEELYFEVAQAAIARGYNCLIFEGPGQGEVIRVRDLPYRYDWEKVVTPVVDYALSRSDVNKDTIALMGISMGGYFAPRAAAFEHRLAACIANGGVYSVAGKIMKEFPPDFIKLMYDDQQKFNSIMEEEMRKDLTTRWFFENGMWTFHTSSPADLLITLEQYNLEGVAQNITCPTLVIDSEADMFFEGQPKELYDDLRCPRDLLKFTRAQTAQAHCQMGATAISNELIFNWLDKIFEK